MSGLQYRDPVRAILAGTVYSGASLSVFDEDGTTLSALFADPGLTTRLSNPLQSDAAGWMPPIYVATGQTYRARLIDVDGAVVFDESGLTAFVLPFAVFDEQPRDMSGALMPFATRTFYLAQTTELTTVYADEALMTPLANPVSADIAGDFPDVWFNVTRNYRSLLKDGTGQLIYDVDQVLVAPDSVPPTPPVLSGELNDDGDAIDLSWTEATSQFSTIAGYRLYDAATDILIVDQPGRTYEFSPVSEGNSYSFYVIAYDALGVDSVQSNIVTISIGVAMEIIPTSRTWVQPENLVSLVYRLFAAGGGGGSGNRLSGDPTGGQGGGGGEYRTGTILAAALGATEDVLIGTGGAGGSPTSASIGIAGGIGGDSSFGAHAVAHGGKGGRAGGTSTSGTGAGGTGGSGGTGVAGGNGGSGAVTGTAVAGASTTSSGAGGGGGAGRNSSGPIGAGAVGGSVTDPSPDTAGGAAGTAGTSGGVIAGDGGSGANGASNTAGAGGGGGGGPGSGASLGARNGGDGGNGGLYGGGGGGSGAGWGSAGGEQALSGQAGNGGNGVLVLFYTYSP